MDRAGLRGKVEMGQRRSNKSVRGLRQRNRELMPNAWQHTDRRLHLGGGGS